MLEFVYVVSLIREDSNEEGDILFDVKVFADKEDALKCKRDNPGASYKKHRILSQYHPYRT